MGKASIYLNFMGNTEEVFNFYKSVFKTEWPAPIMRMGDIPTPEGVPQLSDDDKKKVMHVALPMGRMP